MQGTSDLDAIYGARHGLWSTLKSEVIHILERRLSDAEIKVHNVTGRVKALESIAGKFARKADASEILSGAVQLDVSGPFQFGLKDVVGVRVVCMYLSQIDAIAEVVRQAFTVMEEDRKISGKDVASFGYMSDHFVCTLNDAYKGPRYDDVNSIGFEVQVRTIAMDAWAAVSHHLDYKSEASVPAELKKDFYALSGLFYVADTHFELFSKHVADLRQRLRGESLLDLDKTGELNAETLGAYLVKRFPDRRPSGPEAIQNLLDELVANGYQTIQDVEQSVGCGELAMLESERLEPPGEPEDDEGPSQYATVGAVRIAILLADEKYYEWFIEHHGLDEDAYHRGHYAHLLRSE